LPQDFFFAFGERKNKKGNPKIALFAKRGYDDE